MSYIQYTLLQYNMLSAKILFFLWFLCNRYLYDILTNSTVVKKKIPVLICCNKTDKVTAHTKEFIRKQMEKEMYVFQVYLFLGVWYFG